MSVADILAELPKLTRTDLRIIRRKLIEITEAEGEVSSCDAAALEGAQTLDGIEAGDGAR